METVGERHRGLGAAFDVVVAHRPGPGPFGDAWALGCPGVRAERNRGERWWAGREGPGEGRGGRPVKRGTRGRWRGVRGGRWWAGRRAWCVSRKGCGVGVCGFVFGVWCWGGCGHVRAWGPGAVAGEARSGWGGGGRTYGTNRTYGCGTWASRSGEVEAGGWEEVRIGRGQGRSEADWGVVVAKVWSSAVGGFAPESVRSLARRAGPWRLSTGRKVDETGG